MFTHGCMCTYVRVEATGQSQVPYPKSHPPYFITKTSSLTIPQSWEYKHVPLHPTFLHGYWRGRQLKPWYFCRKCFTIRLPSFQPQALVRAAKGPFDGNRNCKPSSRLAIQFSLVYGFSGGGGRNKHR